MKYTLGITICLIIGYSCRAFGIPLPGPVSWVGVAMIAALWAGYHAAQILSR